MPLNKGIILLFSIFSLFSCTVGPNYQRPSVTVPEKYKEAKGAGWKFATPCDEKNRGEWWKIFHDRILNDLESKLIAHNQSIINAYENYLQSLALVDQARAAFFPNINATASAFRQKNPAFTSSTGDTTTSASSTASGATGGRSSASGRPDGVYSVIFNGSWEPDLWGLVRRTVEASKRGAEANAALYSSTLLSAQGSLAQLYFQLRGLDRDQTLLNAMVKTNKKILAFTQRQYRVGVVAFSDVLQARSQLEVIQAQAINNGIARAKYEHAMAVLIGVPPAHLTIGSHPLTSSPPKIPLDVPSTLLERRPDIAQAERLMAQANAQIGVAVAAYFPTITLSGLVSSVSNALTKLFSAPTMGWSYGGTLAQFIFDGGLRKATVDAAKHAYLASVANYRQVVLSAFQDVEDNLVSLRILTEQMHVQNKAAKDAVLALKLISNQYQAGTIAYNNVLIAQNNAFTAEKTAADTNYLRMVSAVGLIKALGGGWI